MCFPFKKAEKIDLAKRFCLLTLRVDLQNHPAKKDLICSQLLLVGSKGKTASSMNQNWTIAYVANKLSRVYCQYIEYQQEVKAARQNKTVTTSGGNRRPTATESIKFLDKLKKSFNSALRDDCASKEAERVDKERKAAKKDKASRNRTGARPQDDLDFDPAKAEAEPCPKYGHDLCCMAVDSKEDIQQQNDVVTAEYHKKLRRWESLPKKEKDATKKPRKGPTKEQRIGCFCYKTNCLLMPDGGQCHNCR